MNTNPNPRVALDFARRTIAVLIEFCRHVVTMLTGNPSYTTPFPTLAGVTTAIDNLETLNDAALGGGRVAISARKAAKANLISLMRQLAAWVQAHCQNDPTILLSSGFDVTKTPTPVGPLDAPSSPILRRGALSGTLKARVPKVRGAYAYNWRAALASSPTVYVEVAQTAGGRYTFGDLTPGLIYAVQANALGAVGESNWSSSATLMVV